MKLFFPVSVMSLGGIALIATVSSAATSEPPAALDRVMACANEANEQARLRCYDAAVAQLKEATTSGAVVVVDREDVRRTRRSLFGFSVPSLPFFKGDKSQEEQQDEIEGPARSARDIGHGKWLVVMENGAVWQTTQADPSQGVPKPGQTIKIKKGALGSYMLSVNGRRSVRAMRVH